jgi:iron complex outermembrane recepter protein
MTRTKTHRTTVTTHVMSPVMAAVLLALPAAPAGAQTTAESTGTQRVEITGSLIKRLEGEAAAPVQVLRREDIERTGAATVEQLLRGVSAMVSSNATVAASSSSATTGGISTISMRGLTAERTLVLINGRRIAPYGAPNSSVAIDVDSIPIAAIDRVEILKDGASAVYGSDAIAGVVNFILRRSYSGVEAGLGYGAATEDGKARISKGHLVAGFGDLAADRFNLMLQASAQKESPLFGADREFARNAIRVDRNNNLGSSRADPANIGIPGIGLFNPRVDAATQTGDCSPRGVYEPAAGDTICLFDNGAFVTLVPKSERVNFNASARWLVGEGVELFAELGWARKKAQTVIQPAPIDAVFGIPFRMTTANPFYPTAFVQSITGGDTPTLSLRYRPFIIGNRDLTDTATQTRFVFGAQGQVLGWDVDAAALHTTSQVREQLNGGYYRVNDDTSGPGIVPLLSGQVLGADGQPLWLNPFGENNAEIVAAARATNFIGEAFRTDTVLTSLQGKASKELVPLPGGALALALGAETRREGFKLDSNPALDTGNISGFGGNFVDVDVDRPLGALFLELSAPVVKALKVDVALRYDRYGATTNPLNDQTARRSLAPLISAPSEDALPAAVVDRVAADSVGDAPAFGKATGKLGARFEATPQLVLRGTYSTGFRAPSLLDLYGPLQASVSPVLNDPLRCRGADAGNGSFCATQFNTFLGGNSRLTPETSRSLTLGLVFEPVRGFSIGLDHFSTRVRNLIAVRAPDFLLENEALFQDRIIRGPNNEIIAIDQRNENLGSVRIEGVDADVRASMPLAFGRIGFTWAATYMSKWDSENPDGSFTGEIGQTSGAVTGYIPRLRHITGLSFESGPWAVAAQYNWQAGGLDVCGNLEQDAFGRCPEGSLRPFGAYETIDAQLRYSGLPGLVVTLGVRNLLDRDPPYVNGAGGAFQAGYDPTYVDPRGRFAYVQLTYKYR